MNREEFKSQLVDVVDGVVDSDRELTEEDEANLISTFGDPASEILDNSDDEGEAESAEG